MAIEFSDVRGVLFDLDGTFADTAQDLAFALNRTLEHFHRPPLPFDVIRPVVSHGGAAGTGTVVALYGYLQPDDDPASWKADACIAHAGELPAMLGLAAAG